jgi:hypothetical protein
VAKDDPHSATQAIIGSVSLERLHGVALLSNGASRIVTEYRLAEWAGVMNMARATGPDEILRRVRNAEIEAQASEAGDGVCAPDDATVAFCELAGMPPFRQEQMTTAAVPPARPRRT